MWWHPLQRKYIWSGSTCALSCWINTVCHVNFRDLSAKVKCISNACMYIKISLIVFYLEGDFSSPVPRWDICVRWKYEMLLYVVHAGRVGDLYHKYTTSYFNHNLPDPCEKIKFHLWNKCKHCSYWCWHSPLQSHFNIHIYCSVTIVEQNRSVHVSLTSCVHSYIYGLGNIHCIRYLTAVDPFHSTSSAVYKYHHLTPGAVEIPV